MTDQSSMPWLISIVGPTAVGKTAMAIELASWLGTEIISADSRQFYREMTIGTAKPGSEELERVPHHFINSHGIEEAYSAGQFGRDAVDLISKLHLDHQAVVAVGGSTLYLKSLWEGFDEMPEVKQGVREELNALVKEEGLEHLLQELQLSDPTYYEQVDRQNTQRVIRALEVIRSSGKPFSEFRHQKSKGQPYQLLKIGLNTDRETLFDRINQRMDQMIKEGLFEEAESLYTFRQQNALQTVGYSEIFNMMDGSYDRQEAIRLLKRNSRRYAKRQLTWFRKYEDIHWFEPGDLVGVKELVTQKLNLR